MFFEKKNTWPCTLCGCYLLAIVTSLTYMPTQTSKKQFWKFYMFLNVSSLHGKRVNAIYFFSEAIFVGATNVSRGRPLNRTHKCRSSDMLGSRVNICPDRLEV